MEFCSQEIGLGDFGQSFRVHIAQLLSHGLGFHILLIQTLGQKDYVLILLSSTFGAHCRYDVAIALIREI